MMYPNKNLNIHKLQKIFLAVTPFNMAFADYFSKRGDNTLTEYIDAVVEEYVLETGITPEDLIKQIREEYQAYLLTLVSEPEDGTN